RSRGTALDQEQCSERVAGNSVTGRGDPICALGTPAWGPGPNALPNAVERPLSSFIIKGLSLSDRFGSQSVVNDRLLTAMSGQSASPPNGHACHNAAARVSHQGGAAPSGLGQCCNDRME